MARRLRTSLPALACVLCASLAAAPAAHANAFDDVFKSYQRTGKVDACRFSAGDLKKALGQVPNDIEQYAPDFPAALRAASEKRAAGGCEKAAAGVTAGTPATGAPAAGTPAAPGGTAGAAPTATTGVPPADGTPKPTPSSAPAPAVAADRAVDRAAKDDDAGSALPATLVALLAVLGLLALGALAWALARWLVWEPPWLVRARHAGSEAGWRASAAWAEFTDWVRLGR